MTVRVSPPMGHDEPTPSLATLRFARWANLDLLPERSAREVAGSRRRRPNVRSDSGPAAEWLRDCKLFLDCHLPH